MRKKNDKQPKSDKDVVAKSKVSETDPSRTTTNYSQPSSTVSASSLEYVSSSNTNEWYTKIRYINLIREVFQSRIELDPASCQIANKVVGAERYYSITEDGLAQPWNAASVFVNPPYGKLKGKSVAGMWLKKLISEYTVGNVKEAIMLIYANTSEKWFQPALGYPICFTNHRVKFYGPQEGKAPTKGNAFVYFGKSPARFASVFEARDIGTVVSRYRYPQANRIDDIGAPKLFNQSSFYSKTTTNE
jgi:hypothetical protein